jgi:hypothetical protein
MNRNIKEEVIELIKKLPDDITLNDIIYHLYIKQKIIKGIQDIEQGKAIPHEEVMEKAKKRLEEWLK